MNKYMALTKVLLKNGGISLSQDKKKKNKTIAMWVLLTAAFAPTVFVIMQYVIAAYDILSKINQQGLVLGLGISFVSVFIFFFGIFYSLNILYFGNDIENLLPLPFKPSQILGAKFTVALFYEYLTELILLLPLLVIYGIKGDAGMVYYLYSVIIFSILPVIPLAASSVLNMILMSFTNIGRHRDKLKILGGIVAMFLAVGLNIVMQKIGMSSNNPERMLQMLASDNNSLIKTSNKVFPGTAIAARALIYNNSFYGFSNMLLFLLVTVATIFIFLALGERLYLRGVVGISETSSKRRELTSKELTRQVVRKSSLQSITIKELRLLFRTPVYFMNCVLINFLWVVFLMIPVFTQPQIMVEVKKVAELVNNPDVITFTMGVSLAVGIFLGSSNGITSTAISREGQNIFINKYIPVSYKTQITAKLLSGIVLGVAAMITIILVAVIVVKIPIYLAFLILLYSLPGIIFASMVGIIIDLNFPKLHWDNEVKAVKQNLNVVISLIIGMIAAALIGFLVIRFKSSGLALDLFLILLFLFLDYVLYKITINKGTNLLQNIEA